MVADRRGHLVVVDTQGDRILTFEITPRLKQIASTPLPGTPYGVTYDATRDRLWVTLTSLNQVVALDLATETPHRATTLPTVRQPNTVAVDAQTGRVFLASRLGGNVASYLFTAPNSAAGTDGAVQLVDPPT